jgi:diacylglycerol kinase (ATP)
MKITVAIVINPISGVGKQKIVERIALKVLDTTRIQYEIMYTSHAGHLTQLCKEFAAQNYAIVCAVGGDGTMHEAANGLINTNTALCIVPTGSGNGLARHLNISLNTKKALKKINNYTVKQIDCIKINDTYFVNVAGIGFDAYVAHAFANASSRGLSTYIKMCINCINTYKPTAVHAVLDNGVTIDNSYFIVAMGNASQYGNNAIICPHACINNGKISLTFVKIMPWWYLPIFLLQLFTGKLKNSNYVYITEASTVLITQKADIAHFDGEPIHNTQKLQCSVAPKALRIII